MKKDILLIVLVISFIIISIVITTNYIQNTKRIQNISMKIKEGTLTKTGATIIITDNNIEPYAQGEWYRIEKLENEKWKEQKRITDFIAFTTVAILPGEDKILEMKIDWSNIYGELETGKYRIVKRVYENKLEYFYVEFNI